MANIMKVAQKCQEEEKALNHVNRLLSLSHRGFDVSRGVYMHPVERGCLREYALQLGREWTEWTGVELDTILSVARKP